MSIKNIHTNNLRNDAHFQFFTEFNTSPCFPGVASVAAATPMAARRKLRFFLIVSRFTLFPSEVNESGISRILHWS
jgi:hypothetical protein